MEDSQLLNEPVVNKFGRSNSKRSTKLQPTREKEGAKNNTDKNNPEQKNPNPDTKPNPYPIVLYKSPPDNTDKNNPDTGNKNPDTKPNPYPIVLYKSPPEKYAKSQPPRKKEGAKNKKDKNNPEQSKEQEESSRVSVSVNGKSGKSDTSNKNPEQNDPQPPEATDTSDEMDSKHNAPPETTNQGDEETEVTKSNTPRREDTDDQGQGNNRKSVEDTSSANKGEERLQQGNAEVKKGDEETKSEGDNMVGTSGGRPDGESIAFLSRFRNIRDTKDIDSRDRNAIYVCLLLLYRFCDPHHPAIKRYENHFKNIEKELRKWVLRENPEINQTLRRVFISGKFVTSPMAKHVPGGEDGLSTELLVLNPPSIFDEAHAFHTRRKSPASRARPVATQKLYLDQSVDDDVTCDKVFLKSMNSILVTKNWAHMYYRLLSHQLVCFGVLDRIKDRIDCDKEVRRLKNESKVLNGSGEELKESIGRFEKELQRNITNELRRSVGNKLSPLKARLRENKDKMDEVKKKLAKVKERFGERTMKSRERAQKLSKQVLKVNTNGGARELGAFINKKLFGNEAVDSIPEVMKKDDSNLLADLRQLCVAMLTSVTTTSESLRGVDRVVCSFSRVIYSTGIKSDLMQNLMDKVELMTDNVESRVIHTSMGVLRKVQNRYDIDVGRSFFRGSTFQHLLWVVGDGQESEALKFPMTKGRGQFNLTRSEVRDGKLMQPQRSGLRALFSKKVSFTDLLRRRANALSRGGGPRALPVIREASVDDRDGSYRSNDINDTLDLGSSVSMSDARKASGRKRARTNTKTALKFRNGVGGPVQKRLELPRGMYPTRDLRNQRSQVAASNLGAAVSAMQDRQAFSEFERAKGAIAIASRGRGLNSRRLGDQVALDAYLEKQRQKRLSRRGRAPVASTSAAVRVPVASTSAAVQVPVASTSGPGDLVQARQSGAPGSKGTLGVGAGAAAVALASASVASDRPHTTRSRLVRIMIITACVLLIAGLLYKFL